MKSPVKCIIVEGPDCSGKTTFIKKLVEKDKFKNVFVVHFPNLKFDIFENAAKTNFNNLKKTFEKLNNTLYNEEYMNTFVKLHNIYPQGNDIRDLTKEICRNIENNITFNADNKIFYLIILQKVFETFYDIFTKGFEKFSDLNVNRKNAIINFFKSLEYCKIDGKFINNFDFNKDYEDKIYSSFGDYFNNNVIKYSEEIFNNSIIIFDRFNISGLIYNQLVPIAVFEHYLSEIKSISYKNCDFSDNNISSLIDQNKIKEVETIKNFKSIHQKLDEFKKLQDKYDKQINNNLNKLFADNGFKKCDLFMNSKYNVLTPTIINVFFKHSDKLEELAKQDVNRKFDLYDKHNLIKNYSKYYYEHFSDNINNRLFNMLTYDLDKVDLNTDIFVNDFINNIINSDRYLKTCKDASEFVHKIPEILNELFIIIK